MENLKNQKQVHPADVLAKALDRTQGLLATLSSLFDDDDEAFVGGNAFTAHAITTSSTLITEARTALDELQYSCDLTLIHMPAETETVMEVNFPEPAETAPIPAQQVEQATVYAAPPEILPKVVELPQEEPVAKSYLELLRKLTAAEVFAAEQQALSVPGTTTQLLPLLRSLREDLEKIHSAA